MKQVPINLSMVPTHQQLWCELSTWVFFLTASGTELHTPIRKGRHHTEPLACDNHKPEGKTPQIPTNVFSTGFVGPICWSLGN